MPTIPVKDLTHFCEAILEGAGVPRHKAEVAAACLISANLRGVDSHGIQLLPYYVDQLLAGEMDAQADGRVISESGSLPAFRRRRTRWGNGWRRPAAGTPSGLPDSRAWRW